MHAPSSQPRPIEQSRRYTRAALATGETEDGVEGKLVRVLLTDAGASEDERGNWVDRDDVACNLTPRDARFLAIDLIQAADHAEDDEVQGPYLAPWSLPDP